MANLSKETIKRIRTVVQAILAQPKFYNQDRWIDDLGKDKNGVCNTTCCFAGWADYVFNGAKEHNERARRSFGRWSSVDWDEVAAEALLTDRALLDPLTRGHYYWPKQLSHAYDKATTDKGRALALASYVEFFIANDGYEVY